jgi:hypothetical protein
MALCLADFRFLADRFLGTIFHEFNLPLAPAMLWARYPFDKAW